MLILDYSSRQDPAYLVSQGVTGVMRYLSYSAGKNIDRPETDVLLAAGITIGLVWETYADRALSGFAGGQADAQAAYTQAQAVGQPLNRPIYFAVDWDASDAELQIIDDYLRGAASIIGADRVGVYGSFRVVSHCYAVGAARYTWQTYAWSRGQVYEGIGAHLYQYSNGEWGDSVDFNRALQTDYGQWPIDLSISNTGDEMALSASYPPLFPIEGGLECDFTYDNTLGKGNWVNLVRLTRPVHLKVIEPSGKEWERDVNPGSPERSLNFKPQDFGAQVGFMRVFVTGDPAVQPGEVVVEVRQLT